MRLTVAIAVCVLLAGSVARAQPEPDTVALLPLEAEGRVKLYGQPVASEIARALVAGKIDVVVLGPRTPVPERTRLIVDGSVKTSKGDAVVVSIRIRNPVDGTVLETLTEPADSLETIDKAAAAISGRMLPLVRDRIAALHRTVAPNPPEVRQPPVATIEPMMLVGITAARSATIEVEPLRVALVDQVTAWTRASHRVPEPVDSKALIPKLAAKTVAARRAERAMAFEVIGFTIDYVTIEHVRVPLVHARVRVRIADATAVVFDHVIVTDTIVGERNNVPDVLAARTASAVLEILRPHMRRLEPTWR